MLKKCKQCLEVQRIGRDNTQLVLVNLVPEKFLHHFVFNRNGFLSMLFDGTFCSGTNEKSRLKLVLRFSHPRMGCSYFSKPPGMNDIQ